MSSDKWNQVYRTRDALAFYRRLCIEADLYVSCGTPDNPSGTREIVSPLYDAWRIVDGGKVIPGGFGYGYGDPRRLPKWEEFKTTYPSVAMAMLTQRGIDGASSYQSIEEIGRFHVNVLPGDFYSQHHDGSWADAEIEYLLRLTRMSARACRAAVMEWLKIHDINGFILTDEQIADFITTINAAEAGDEMARLMLLGGPQYPDVSDRGDPYLDPFDGQSPRGGRGLDELEENGFLSFLPGDIDKRTAMIWAGAGLAVLLIARRRKGAKS